MNEEGLKQFPEATHEWDEIKNSDTPEIFWDRMTNMRSKFGTGVFKPGDDAGAEDWGKFTNKVIELSGERLMPRPDLEDAEQQAALFKTLGRPDDLKDYEFAEIEGHTLPDERKEFIAKIAHEIGLTKKQLKILDQKVRESDIQNHDSSLETFNNQLKDLKQEWGLTYDERVHAAKKIAKTFFPQLAEDTNFSSAELKSFYSLAKQFGSNGQEFQSQGDQGNNLMSPDEAATKISEIRNNKDHPYNNPQAQGHQLAKDKMRKLYLIKTGEATE